MKLERLHEYVLTAVVIAVGMGLALVAGSSTGGGQMKTVVMIVGGICLLALVLGLRTSIWLLVPLCWSLGGTVPATKLPFTVRDYAVLLVAGSFLLFYALKQLRYRPRFELFDTIIIANLLYLVTVYLRNPVGADWLGSELVGGKPYFDIFIAFLAYQIISRAPIHLPTLRRLPLVLLAGNAFVAFGSMVAFLRPSLGDRLGQLYSLFAAPDPQLAAAVDEDTIGRKPLLGGFGDTGMRLFTSYFSPATFLSPIHPLRFLGTTAFMAAILFSGFRSALFGAFVYIAMSCHFRKRWHEGIIFGVLGAVVLAVLALGNNRIFTLPLSAQRALSFLPGEWDYMAVSDARGSSEWRYQIWRMALFEDGWIRNKWLGDGFGFTSYQLSIMNSREGYLGGAGAQEAFLVAGNYHSGPISTIRYAGAVGLILLVPLIWLLAVRGYRLIQTSTGTRFFPVALFVGMPMVYFPIPFILIAGGYDTGLADLLFSAGVLRLLERALQQQKASAPQKDEGEARPMPERIRTPQHRGPRPGFPLVPR